MEFLSNPSTLSHMEVVINVADVTQDTTVATITPEDGCGALQIVKDASGNVISSCGVVTTTPTGPELAVTGQAEAPLAVTGVGLIGLGAVLLIAAQRRLRNR